MLHGIGHPRLQSCYATLPTLVKRAVMRKPSPTRQDGDEAGRYPTARTRSSSGSISTLTLSEWRPPPSSTPRIGLTSA
jgi:hypothetical protein